MKRYSRMHFVEYLADRNGWNKHQVLKILDQTLNCLGDFLLEKCDSDGCSLTITHFGRFVLKPAVERKVKPSRPGKEVEISRNRIFFYPSSDFQKIISGD